MYKEKKVYVSWCDTFKVHICEGSAKDRAIYGNRNVEESRLLYTGGLENLTFVYRAEEFGSTPITSWFGTRQEAIDAAKRVGCKKDYVVQEACLDTTVIAPVTFPLHVHFERGIAGRLVARLNLHPEVNGNYGKPKVYFPDKSLIGACAGEAIITGAKEFARFGFLTGKMVKCEMPEDMGDFLDWAWKTMDANDVIATIDHPGRGRYLATNAGGYIKPCGKGHYDVMFSFYFAEDLQKYCVAKHRLADLFIADAFEGETANSLFGKFGKSTFILQGARFQGTRWQYTDKYYSDLADVAVNEGIIKPVTLPGTSIIAIDVIPAEIYRLSCFSVEEVNELAALVSTVNKKADEDIAARMRKGKLHII